MTTAAVDVEGATDTGSRSIHHGAALKTPSRSWPRQRHGGVCTALLLAAALSAVQVVAAARSAAGGGGGAANAAVAISAHSLLLCSAAATALALLSPAPAVLGAAQVCAVDQAVALPAVLWLCGSEGGVPTVAAAAAAIAGLQGAVAAPPATAASCPTVLGALLPLLLAIVCVAVAAAALAAEPATLEDLPTGWPPAVAAILFTAAAGGCSGGSRGMQVDAATDTAGDPPGGTSVATPSSQQMSLPAPALCRSPDEAGAPSGRQRVEEVDINSPPDRSPGPLSPCSPGRRQFDKQQFLNADKEQRAELRRAITLSPKPGGKGGEVAARWRKGAMLGQGANGTVHIGLNEVTGELMAVKNIQFDAKAKDVKKKVAMLQQEISLMKRLSHENIVSYFFTEKAGASVNIFMEYVPGGSLANVMKQFGPFPIRVAAGYTEQVLHGLSYLHREQVIHRDVKCANVLLSVEGVCKLADFGASISQDAQDRRESMIGTPVWMAPEVITSEGHDWRADIWSLGCTVLEMLTGEAPFSGLGMNQIQTMKFIADASQDVERALPAALQGNARLFVTCCLNRSAPARPSAVELLLHPYLVEDDALYAEDTELVAAHRASIATLHTQQHRRTGSQESASTGTPSSFVAPVRLSSAFRDQAALPPAARGGISPRSRALPRRVKSHVALGASVSSLATDTGSPAAMLPRSTSDVHEKAMPLNVKLPFRAHPSGGRMTPPETPIRDCTSDTASTAEDFWPRSTTDASVVSSRYMRTMRGKGVRGLSLREIESEHQRILSFRERDIAARASLLPPTPRSLAPSAGLPPHPPAPPPPMQDAGEAVESASDTSSAYTRHETMPIGRPSRSTRLVLD
eukprot:TRINITY_DN27315_c0_g3_i1.p1 TRINITY_DN27315_c0_g3~~TRINITY_DN27315_c0_g3_i1.p1  ORF type:complete len:881 (+),score=177.29 TRINITY_DN27315_c0_g3_i1:72-2645(+)